DAEITFSLYFGALTPTDLFSGTNAGSLITNVVLSNADFKIQNPNDQQYNPVIFQFTDNLGSNAPLTLSNGVTYTAALTSPALDKASYQYFIKGGDALLSTTNVPPIVNTNDISNVPEPATYILMGLGALLLLISYNRRRAE
ncbi:MAG: PEP-CTERM sorting domain-containing protein, partial [Chthoniobacterales bacterium]